MRIRIFTTLVAWLFLAGAASAADLTVIRTETANWPLVRVVVSTQEADAAARDYTLALPTGKTVAADRVTELLDQPLPASMVVALDTSRSLSPKHLDAAKNSLSRYVDRLASGEQLSLLGFNDNVELVIGFTADREAFKSTLADVRLGGQRTELYRAMLYGVENLKNIPGQRTLLVITDGKDEGTDVSLEQVIEAAKENGVRILAIGLPILPGEESETYLPKMQRLTEATGGIYRSAPSAEELGDATYTLMVENQGQAAHVYALEFTLPGSGMPTTGEVTAQLSRNGEANPAALLLAVPRNAIAAAEPTRTGGEPARRTGESIADLATSAAIIAPEMDRSARPVGALQPDVAPAAAVEKTATPSPVQTAPPANRPAAEPTNIKALWLWFLLALLALLLLWFLLRKKKGTVYATTSRDNAVPLVIEFPDLDLRYPIRPGTMILGSGPDNHIRLDDPDVEEAHAEFCTGPDCELRKLSGSYGVLLNGKEVERSVKLKPGDTLSIGNTKAVIRSAEE